MKKTNMFMTVVAMVFVIGFFTGVQNVSAQGFDDPSGRYAWVLSGGKRVVTSKNIFVQPVWTEEIDKTLTWKSATEWMFTGKEAWNEQGTNAALTVIYADAQIGCNEQGHCYLKGCYRGTRRNRLHFNVGIVVKEKEIRTEVVVPDIIVQNDNTAIAQAIAQVTNSIPQPQPYVPTAWCQVTVNGMLSARVRAGESVSIRWITGNAAGATLLGENVALTGTKEIVVPTASTLVGMIVTNSLGASMVCGAEIIVEGKQDKGFSFCEPHGGFWGTFLDVMIGAAAGALSGRLSQGYWGWASAVGAGAGAVAGYAFGPCIGAAVGGGVGLLGFLDQRDTLRKNPLSGVRGGRDRGATTWNGGFTPAQGTTAPASGPPGVISVTPIGSNTGGTTTVPPGTGGIKPPIIIRP